VDDAAWGALTLTLTLLGGLYTWFAFRRRGFVAGLRGVGITLVPLALLLTNSLRMVTEVGDAVGDWALELAWNPFTWLGLILGGVSVVCFVVSGFLAHREVGTAPRRTQDDKVTKALPEGRGKRSEPVLADPIDAEMAEIEALLRKRGIT
jgi:hypothetical protein